MLSLFTKSKQVDLAPYVRRICDLTTPNRPVCDDGRTEQRYLRVIPVVTCPWADELPDISEASTALTSDISDRGIGLVMTTAPSSNEIVIGFWLSNDVMSEPWFFRAKVQMKKLMGGGYWDVGTQLEEYMTDAYRDELEALSETTRSTLGTE